MPTPPRLYADLAHLWPLLSPPEDYEREAAIVRQIIEAHAAPVHSVLELGAGGGHTLHHLADAYETVAVDLSDAMLAHCRGLNPGVPTVVGDMRTVRLGRTFDALLIHDAIDYMTSRDDALAALQTAAAHLQPGGLAVIAPTYVRETFTEHETAHDHRKTDALTLTYFSYVHDPDPADETFELVLVYLIRHADGSLSIEHDRHTCGLFSVDDWLAMLDAAGFDATLRHEPDSAAVLFTATRR